MIVLLAYNCVFVNTHWIVSIKMVNFIVCKLYFKKADQRKCSLFPCTADRDLYKDGEAGSNQKRESRLEGIWAKSWKMDT